KVQVGNGITDFIVYNFQENGMEIASHLDPNDEKAFTSMIHELYHLYQDHQKVAGSMLGIETQAYFKASEYVWRFFERGAGEGKYRNPEDFIQKSFPNADTLAYHPIALSFRAFASRKSGDQKIYEASLNQFKQAMNIQYYLGGLLSAAVNEAVKTPLIPADYDPNDLQKLLRLVEHRIERLGPEKER